MNLAELFRNPKLSLSEGGNVSNQSPGWQGVPGDHQAQELDLHVHNRAYVQDIVSQLLHTINDVFASQFKEPLWHENSVKTQKFLSGSTLQFMDKKISDEEFIRVKPKVGDIDTQASDQHADTIKQFLQNNTGKMFGNAMLLGFTPGNSQWVSLWEIKLKDLPVKIQIDFEYGAHEKETGLPTDWQSYSHSSAWDDISQNIKGVFHKYLDRALPYAQASTKYVARVLKKSTKISDAPVTDSDYSFAVSGPGGGGVSQKYVPYVDPATGQPMEKDGIPVMQLLEPGSRQYVQNLSQQFEIFFGRKPKGNDQQLKNSFVGTVQLIAKYLDEQKKDEIARRFFSICFEPGSQMITRGDPARDRDIKFAAIDWMLENMQLANAAGLRKEAIDMATAYAAAFQNKSAAKAAPLKEEAQVKAQLRKGMPHLHDLKPADLLDLLDEIHDGNGNFKLQNIPLNVKVDGFGGRFGKNSDGKPFMGTSRTEPRYEPGFVAYHQKKGTTDPEVLGRAQLFDDLFTEMMAAVKLVDSKLGPGFLVNKQVTCEVLYLPFATETPEGKLKFVGIHYDKLPAGVKLALVPFRITDATTGEDLPNSNKIVQELTSVGQSGSVMFIDNSLTQNEALDVTALVPPVENIDELKAMLASNKLEARRQVKAALEPVAAALEKAIINDPNIIGKDLLGQDYEGIVINSRLGPIKVTSQEQRDVITAKNAAKASARTERPRGEAKTAVVAIGSFVGHIGHEQLWDYTTKKAAAVGGDPYLFIGNAQGKDDPIPPAVKVQTWHKLYPEYAKNISTVTQDGGSLIQKIKHELINPLPSKPPRYDNIIIMVGEDQAGLTMPQALMKAVNKFQGYEHVKVSLEVTPRGTGMSFSKLRNILKDPNATEQQQFALWSQAFDVNKLGAEWIKHLMDITRKGMGIQQPQAPVPQPQPAPVAEQRILNALIRPINENTSNAMSRMARDLTGPGAPDAKRRAQRDQQRQQDRAQSDGRDHGPKWDVEEALPNPGSGSTGNSKEDKRIAAALRKKHIPTTPNNKKEQGAAEGVSLKQKHEDKKRADQNQVRYGKMTQAEFDKKWSRTERPNPTSKEQGVAEGPQDDPEDYREHLLKTLPRMMNFLSKNVQGWKPTEDQYLAAIETGYQVMKHTGDVQQAGRAMSDELNTLHRMSQSKSGMMEDLSRRGFLKGAGAAAIGGAAHADDDAAHHKLPDVIAHITIRLNGKTIEKEINLGTEYQSPMEARQAVEKWLAEKGIKNYTIRLERAASVNEAPKSAAVRLGNAIQRVQGKTAASQARSVIPSSIPKPEPKKDEKVAEENPNQQLSLYNPNGKTYRTTNKMPTLGNDPVDKAQRFEPSGSYEQDFNKEEIKRLIATNLDSLNDKQKTILKLRFWDEMTYDEIADEFNITRERIRQIEAKAIRTLKTRLVAKDITPDTIDIAEKMMPASNFAGSKKNKLGPAGQWKNTGPKKNRPAQAGDLVGGMEEGLRDSEDNPCWKGYKPVGTKKKSGKTVPNCVPVSENVENIMDALINKIVVNEAIQNNRK